MQAVNWNVISPWHPGSQWLASASQGRNRSRQCASVLDLMRLLISNMILCLAGKWHPSRTWTCTTSREKHQPLFCCLSLTLSAAFRSMAGDDGRGCLPGFGQTTRTLQRERKGGAMPNGPCWLNASKRLKFGGSLAITPMNLETKPKKMFLEVFHFVSRVHKVALFYTINENKTLILSFIFMYLFNDSVIGTLHIVCLFHSLRRFTLRREMWIAKSIILFFALKVVSKTDSLIALL